MTFSDHLERFFSNLQRKRNVLIAKGTIDKQIVVIGEENAPPYAFGNPFLMQNQIVVIGNTHKP